MCDIELHISQPPTVPNVNVEHIITMTRIRTLQVTHRAGLRNDFARCHTGHDMRKVCLLGVPVVANRSFRRTKLFDPFAIANYYHVYII